MLTLPTFPRPIVLACRTAPLVTLSEPAVRLTLPPCPVPWLSTRLYAPVEKVLAPSKEAALLTFIFTLPASPCPRMPAYICAPLVAVSEFAVRLTLPPVPVAFSSKALERKVPSPSRTIAPAAFTSIFPAKASGAPDFSDIPVRSVLPRDILKF